MSLELQRVAQKIPDSRERLDCVGNMTDNAAHRVLSLVESAKLECGAQALHAGHVARLLATNAERPDLDIAQARRMLEHAAAYAKRMEEFAERQNQVLGDIAMTQDFQDLPG